MGAFVHWHGGTEASELVDVEMHVQVRHERASAEAIGLFSEFRGETHRGKGSLAIFAPMEAVDQPLRVLLVEDEEALRLTLKLNFELEGYAVTTAATGPEGLERLRGAHFDLVVMDVMLPGVDGYSVVESVRLEGNTTPVIFLTARTAPADRIRGLRVGDDHLGKPFELEELLLRVRKLLQRAGRSEAEPVVSHYAFAGNTVDFVSYIAKGRDGQERTLSQREMMLLRLLVEREGEVVSREEILQKVWGYNVFPTTRTVDNFIVAFRKYFEEDPRTPRHFHSIRGVGYRFTP
jgi:two-component system, OmpR family, alkaline phosphatase synthesis response regulator PhoP